MTTSASPHPAPGSDGDVSPHEVTIGILTALPPEARAVTSLLDDVRRYRATGDRNVYRVGIMPSSEPGQPHLVAHLTMTRDGTQLAATCCANMLRTFPNIQTVVMTGIAGGIPRPDDPGKHVRLGDVVVAVDGIVNYGSIRQEDGTQRLRGRQGAGLVSHRLLQAVQEIQVEEDGERGWERFLDPGRTAGAAAFPRPDPGTDVLYVRRRPHDHPARPGSAPPEGVPRVHYGVVGSADVLMVDEEFRDRLAAENPDMLAIEMEASGIAASTAAVDRTWFRVRGIADYSELHGKNNVWHDYASYTAAAYVRALLAVAAPIEVGPRPSPGRLLPLVEDAEQEILDKLLAQVPADLDLWPLWQATVPDRWDVPVEVLDTSGHAYHSLARLNADAYGLPPALLFLARLARRLQGTVPALAAGLRSWVAARTERMGLSDVLRDRLATDSPAQPAGLEAGPLLLIELTVDGLDRSRCRISPYLQGAAGPWSPRPVEGSRVELTGIEAAVGGIIADAERAWGKGNAVGQAEIEFLLPVGLLNLPVQWYRAAPRLGLVQPICVQYPVAVRSVERMRENGVRLGWVNRWNVLDRQPFAGEVHWGVGYHDKKATVDSWAAELIGDNRYVVVVLSEPPTTDLGRRELVAAFAAGIPVILWDQRLGRTLGDLADALSRWIADPAKLPVELRALRVESERVVTEDPDHYGRSVALLWDDPRRVVSGERRG